MNPERDHHLTAICLYLHIVISPILARGLASEYNDFQQTLQGEHLICLTQEVHSRQTNSYHQSGI